MGKYKIEVIFSDGKHQNSYEFYYNTLEEARLHFMVMNRYYLYNELKFLYGKEAILQFKQSSFYIKSKSLYEIKNGYNKLIKSQ